MQTPRAALRSHLYVPGDRADRLASALRREADAVIVDLEDAVAWSAKQAARDTARAWLTSLGPAHPQIWVRINSAAERASDVDALLGCGAVTGLCVAKTESALELEELDEVLTRAGSSWRVAPLLESAVAVEAVREIARAPRVAFLHLGEVDLAADLDLTPGEDGSELLAIRSTVVIASRSAGLEPPVAPVSAELEDMAAFERTSRQLRRMGFFGRACIHPRQVAVANAVHTPAAAEVDRAREVIALATAAEHGALRDRHGAMVDEAVVRRARRIVDLADVLR